MLSSIKKLPIGVQVFGAGASLFLLYKMYQISAGGYVEKKQKQKEEEDSKASALVNFENKVTYTPDQLKEFTQSLGEILQYGLGKNKPELESILLRMNNNADVKTLLFNYGKKMSYLYGSPTGQKTLLQALANVEAEDKNKINIDWRKKGIKFKI
jgi:hypothetical protein